MTCEIPSNFAFPSVDGAEGPGPMGRIEYVGSEDSLDAGAGGVSVPGEERNLR